MNTRDHTQFNSHTTVQKFTTKYKYNCNSNDKKYYTDYTFEKFYYKFND